MRARTGRPRWRWRRGLLVVHRVTALACGVVVLAWFASGFVMLFHGYPSPRDAERLAWRPVLAAEDVPATPGAIPAGTRVLRWPRAAPLDREAALARVRARLDPRASYDRRIVEPDQWTLYPSMVAQLPAHRLVTSTGTLVYLAEADGALVQLATPRARRWAWLGAIPHWLYPRVLVVHRPAWRWTVLGLATVGLLNVAVGLALGVRSLRRGRSPFARRWLRVHHVAGLVFVGPTLAWLFSGALSLEPFAWVGESRAIPPAVAAAFEPPLPASVELGPADAARTCLRHDPMLRALELRVVAGAPSYVCRSPHQTRVLPAQRGAVPEAPAITQARGRAHARAHGLTIDLAGVRDDDRYYYASRHGGERPPALRFELAGRHVYLDAATLRPLASLGARARLERWLYHGLHSLDPAPLRTRPGLRYALAGGLLLGGGLLAATGLLGLSRWLRGRPRGAGRATVPARVREHP